MGYPVLGLVAGVALLAIAALTPRKWSFSQTEPCEFTVYVSGDEFHTNFFVPVETSVYDWGDHLNLDGIAGSSSKDYRYLQFGWGDRIFYMETPSWDQVSPTNALRSLFFWQNASAMFVKGHSSVPHFPNETLKCIRLSKTDYLALMNFIDTSFQADKQGHKQRIGSGQDQQSGFYAAHGYYSAIKTCNSWTADGLRAANINTPLWAGLAAPIMYHLRNGCECDVLRDEEMKSRG
ncbi:MAG: TIGR02117 family protein [Leptolyngbyaceae cyanobacterium RU_5_1]|nr:TIGR02117 family protein [Leptolyngbyaceae cyanobacterium RU_5_1]